jgi:alpha-L-rhamnosidase
VPGWKEGEPVSVATAFYYYDVSILARVAGLLGREAEAVRYEALAERIRSSYNAAFYDPAAHRYDQGSQFSNAFPLYLGLVDRAERGAVLDAVLSDLRTHEDHFTVGVLGARYLIDALTDAGRTDVAFRLATQTGYPSWAHMLEGGRTTLSEFWNLKGSHNHAMMGSIDAWFYQALAGIRWDDSSPGFERFEVRPHFDPALGYVRAGIQTVRGRVTVHWQRQGSGIRTQVTVPVNARARVHLPAGDRWKVTSEPVATAIHRGSELVFEVGSGTSEFRIDARAR